MELPPLFIQQIVSAMCWHFARPWWIGGKPKILTQSLKPTQMLIVQI